jgi:hypothetical protein
MSTYTRMLLLQVVDGRLASVIKWNCRHSHGNMNELNQVPDKPHDGETDRDSLGNLNKFYASKWRINMGALV